MSTFRRRFSLALLPWVLASPSLGAQTSAPAPGLSTGALLNVVLSLGLVVVVIVALGWLLRRFNNLPRAGGSARMRVLSALSVGTRERVVLVDVAGEQMLLGVAPGQVALLCRFDEPVVEAAAGGGDFQTRLRQAIAGKAGRE